MATGGPPGSPAPADAAETRKKPYREIRAGHEIRIKVDDEGEAKVRLLQGLEEAPMKRTKTGCEVNGKSLPVGAELRLSAGTRAAVYSWTGSMIEVTGAIAHEYDAANATMREYFHVAAILEQQRVRAEERGEVAPRVLVTGSASSGKTTLCQLLCNYALRRGRCPTYLELDPRGAGDFRQLPALPGCIGATTLDACSYDLENEPFDPTAAEDTYPFGRSVFFFVGGVEPQENLKVYEWAAFRLSRVVKAKLKRQTTEDERIVARSGVIANAPASPTVGTLTQLIKDFAFDVVLVLDDEALHAEIMEMRPDGIEVVQVPKSGGVQQNTLARTRKLRTQRVRDYLYGPARELYPHSLTIPKAELKLFVIEEPEELPAGMLPIGQTEQDTQLEVKPYTGAPATLVNCLIAFLATSEVNDVRFAPLGGLAYVSSATAATTDSYVLLCPAAPPLISNIALVGDTKNLKFIDIA